MKSLLITLFLMVSALYAKAQIEYGYGDNVPTGIRLKNGPTTSNGYYQVDLTSYNGRAAGGIGMGLTGSVFDRYWLFVTHTENNQYVGRFQINFGVSTRFAIDTVGNVGIGIKNPWEKLVVDGKIVAEEVRVENVPASDYVFEPDYPLLPISEVESFVKAEKHLPGIPSAAEFKENGVGLGEMDDMLLRKLEELTLYVIEQNKRMEKMEMENGVLREELKDLKKLVTND